MDETIIVRAVTEISRSSISVAIVQVDKSVIVKPPHDTEMIYAEAISILTRSCLSAYPRLELHIDKRYSNPLKQIWLERWIRDDLADQPDTALIIRQEDSIANKALQVADFVAWSVGKKALGDERFWKTFEPKVFASEVLRRERWL